MRKILITGGGGFVGRNLLPFYSDSADEIHVIDKAVSESLDGFEWHVTDLGDHLAVSELIEKIRPTHLLHLAWHVPPQEFWISAENVAWIHKSFELLKSFTEKGGQRAVLVGSCAEYDWEQGICDELKTPLNPSTLYGVCKRSLFETASSYTKSNNLSFAWARLFFMFGSGEPKSKLTADMINCLLRGEKASCKNASLIRDYLYVKEAAKALKVLLESHVEGPVNISSGRGTRLGDIAEKTGEILNKLELIELNDDLGSNDPPQIIGQNERLTKEVGWIPEYDLERALREYIETFY